VHVDGDLVNGMAAYQPVVLVCTPCGDRMKTLCVHYFWFVSYDLLILIADYGCAKWQSFLKQSVLKRLSRDTYVSVGMAASCFADRT
jgi:hypothetical protein